MGAVSVFLRRPTLAGGADHPPFVFTASAGFLALGARAGGAPLGTRGG